MQPCGHLLQVVGIHLHLQICQLWQALQQLTVVLQSAHWWAAGGQDMLVNAQHWSYPVLQSSSMTWVLQGEPHFEMHYTLSSVDCQGVVHM